MSRSDKDDFKEERANDRLRRQRWMAVLIIFFSVLVTGIWWYLDSISNERQVPQQSSPQQSTQVDGHNDKESGTAAPVAEPAIEPAVEEQKQPEPAGPLYTILIDKSDYRLYVLRDNEVVKQWGVAVGAKPGQKQRAGDMTTPTGDFVVDEILDASYWTHDFGDGKGEIAGAYGPNFISLVTGWDGIGIHGTHAPESIGTMVSEGCVRMRNDELLELLPYVDVGTKVTIRE